MGSEDKYRPEYHFTPPQYWMNDPNGLCFYKDEYHLFYQHNPFENEFGHLSWGHAVSKDLVHWEHLPVAIPEGDGIMIFSGSIVIDYNNTSGLGTGDTPPFIAVYTGHRSEDGRQFQCLAYSDDKGRTWSKYKNNPVLDIGSSEFRDPKVFYYEPENVWIMIAATGLENRMMFFASSNLIDWEHISDFSYPEFKKVKWECPDIFRLPVIDDMNEFKWVLFVSRLSDSIATDTGCTYFIGDFNGKEFVLDERFKAQLERIKEVRLDNGRDFYAASTWSSNIGKGIAHPICIAWMNNWKYAEKLPTSGWNGAMTIPRRLLLKHDESGYQIVQKPYEELEKLRKLVCSLQFKDICEVDQYLFNNPIVVSQSELNLEINYEEGGIFILELYNDNRTELLLKYDDTLKMFSVDRTGSNKIVPDDAFYQFQEVEHNAGGSLKLSVFVDHSSIEVFINEGETVISSLFLPSSTNNMIRVSETSMKTTFCHLRLWDIQSTSKN